MQSGIGLLLLALLTIALAIRVCGAGLERVDDVLELVVLVLLQAPHDLREVLEALVAVLRHVFYFEDFPAGVYLLELSRGWMEYEVQLD